MTRVWTAQLILVPVTLVPEFAGMDGPTPVLLFSVLPLAALAAVLTRAPRVLPSAVGRRVPSP